MNVIQKIIDLLVQLGFSGPAIIEIINDLLSKAPKAPQEWTPDKVKTLVDSWKAEDSELGTHFDQES